MSKEYSSKNIKTLHFPENVQQRSTMYIGELEEMEVPVSILGPLKDAAFSYPPRRFAPCAYCGSHDETSYCQWCGESYCPKCGNTELRLCKRCAPDDPETIGPLKPLF